MMKVNEEKGNEFIVMSYTSTPKVTEMGNKLVTNTPPPFAAYVEAFTDWGRQKGWKTCAIVTTLGAYGDEWRYAFKAVWEEGRRVSSKIPPIITRKRISPPPRRGHGQKPTASHRRPSATPPLVIEQPGHGSGRLHHDRPGQTDNTPRFSGDQGHGI
jgi:branched-chain amino acid transport system substrate-binding protein